MSNAIDRNYGGPPDYGHQPMSVHDAEAQAIEVWAGRTVREAQRGRHMAWTVTGFLILVCAAQAAAIAIMLPLKEVQPYTLLVDRQTGYVETVRGLRLGELAEDEAVVHAFLAQYLLARETFDPADFEDRYTRVALWSIDQARADYVAAYQPGAKTGVLAEMRPGSLVTVTVKKIEVLDRNLARVRFESIRRDPGMEAVRQDFRAIISFRFVGAPMRMEDRLINPLGFQVTTYRRDAEAGPIAEEAKTATAAPPEALEAADDGKAEPSPAGQKPDSGAASATPKTDMPGLAKRKDEKPVGPIKPADSQRAPQDVQP